MKILKMENWFDCNNKMRVNVGGVYGENWVRGIGLGVLDCVLNAYQYKRVHFVKSKRKFRLNGVERFGSNGFVRDEYVGFVFSVVISSLDMKLIKIKGNYLT